MQARMKNPTMLGPDALKALQALHSAAEKGGVPSTTLGLIHLRASQVNGCSFCVDMGSRTARKAGELDRHDQRLQPYQRVNQAGSGQLGLSNIRRRRAGV
jgi:AhpD family alkylhydroperoxidase